MRYIIVRDKITSNKLSEMGINNKLVKEIDTSFLEQTKCINGIEYVTPKYVGLKLGVSATTLHDWRRNDSAIKKKSMPMWEYYTPSLLFNCHYINIGNRIYYHKETLDKCVEELTKGK